MTWPAQWTHTCEYSLKAPIQNEGALYVLRRSQGNNFFLKPSTPPGWERVLAGRNVLVLPALHPLDEAPGAQLAVRRVTRKQAKRPGLDFRFDKTLKMKYQKPLKRTLFGIFGPLFQKKIDTLHQNGPACRAANTLCHTIPEESVSDW